MKTFKVIFLLILLGFTATIWITTRFYTNDLQLKSSRINFTIPAGSSLQAAAQIIESSGVDMPAWQLALFGRALGRAASIKAGSYEIESGISAIELMDKLTRGDVRMTEVVLLDGKTFAQWRAVMNENPNLTHDTLKMSNADILQRLEIKEQSPEGLFFPDTYLIDKDGSDLDVLRRAYRAMQKRLATAWAGRDQMLNLKTPYELLILASIVEKETGQAKDRPEIAAVFVNRLRKGMPLQSDPTVIFGMGSRFDGNLRRADLIADTPWNTYTRSGLPPTPISMPSQAALQAVSHPPLSNNLYFVARGDGSSEFSSTLEDHNRAVSQYQKGGK